MDLVWLTLPVKIVRMRSSYLPLLSLTFEYEHFKDFLQFTLTSRTEMPNEEFSAALNKASEDMLAVFKGETKAKL